MPLKDLEQEYEQNTGRKPTTLYPSGHEAAWEWTYEGRSDQDKQNLLGLISQPEEPLDSQESLF